MATIKSIEEKAKAYDEAIDRANELLYVSDKESLQYQTIKHILPELIESEDEKIRNFISNELACLRATDGKGSDRYNELTEAIAWVEKQGEHANFLSKIQIGDKVTRNQDGALVNLSQLNRVAKKPADKVKPKFHEGDWVIGRATENEPRQIAEITEEGYKTTYGGWIGFSFEEDMRLWTIKDAKDGDILADNVGIIVFRKIGNEMYEDVVDYHCVFLTDRSGRFEIQKKVIYWGKTDNAQLHPATKEQRDTLMKAMYDAGYTFNFEKKELKKIEQKPATWSEEDEGFLKLLLAIFTNEHPNGIFSTDNITVFKGNCVTSDRIIDWLKSLKDRVSCEANCTTTKEWSDEDSIRLQRIIDFLWYNRKGDTDTIYQQEQDIEWLKSFRLQKQ